MTELNLDEILNSDSDSLDLDEIEFLLGTQKQRGVFKPFINNFIESGETHTNVSNAFPGREAASLKNSINIRIKQDFPNEDLRLLIVGKKETKQAVLLVNMPLYTEAMAAKKAAEAASAEDEATESQ